MLVLTILVGMVVWAVTDTIQNYSLRQIFNNKLSERFGWEAEKQRIMFDRYVKGHHQAIRMFIGTQRLHAYINSNAWKNKSKQDNNLQIHSSTPEWLPKLSIIRNFFQPRYFILLDNKARAQEIYQATTESIPDDLIKPSSLLLKLTNDQGFLTLINNKPYLLASSSILNKQNQVIATLMLASPLDEEFLIASQASALADSNVIALLAEDTPNILASSNSILIPPGTRIEALKDNYLTIGQGFFDYGATDITIELVSFISTEEAQQLTDKVLSEERPMRGIIAIIYIIAIALLMYFITRRIRNFTNYIIDFSRNMKLEPPSAGGTKDEISILENSFHTLVDAIQTETQALEYQALHDSLTELPNRKLLHNRLEQEILRSQRTSTQFVLIISDLNRFKEINDTLGHHIGDVILQQSGDRLQNIFRKSDTVARLGGDEFAILLPETNIDTAKMLTRKVIEEFSKPFSVENHTLSVDISMGLAEFPTHGDTGNILMQRADVAMYIAKNNKLGYTIYDPNKDTHSIGRLALMHDLRHAIESELLDLYYQPKIDLQTNSIIGVEALLRWHHPMHGSIQPEEFVAIAVQTGLIKPLTDWVLERALKQHAEWAKQNIHLSMAVNLSVHNLHDKELIQKISYYISKNKMAPSSLVLEITEGDIMTEPVRARDVLKQLYKLGISLSIDDFGTGYSSLSYLQQLPVNEIKIDRSFIMEMNKYANDEVIVKATIDLAHNLNLKVVAEGVEDEATWLRLKELGCDIVQGIHISPAVSANDLNNWLTNKNIENKSRAN